MRNLFRTFRQYYRTLGPKGIGHLLHAYAFPSSAMRQIHHPGLKHSFHLRIGSADVLTYRQVFVDEEYAFEPTHTPRSIIDAGANIGLASLYFANRFPNASIISVEPEEHNYRLLEKNVSAYPQIKTVQAAVWRDNEEISVVDPGLGEWGYQTAAGAGLLASRPRHAVQGLTIDRLMADHGIEFVDILKIDIEGAEKEVFEDPSLWINRVGILIIELHEHLKIGCSRNFYNATNHFSSEWLQGENVFLTRSPYSRSVEAKEKMFDHI